MRSKILRLASEWVKHHESYVDSVEGDPVHADNLPYRHVLHAMAYTQHIPKELKEIWGAPQFGVALHYVNHRELLGCDLSTKLPPITTEPSSYILLLAAYKGYLNTGWHFSTLLKRTDTVLRQIVHFEFEGLAKNVYQYIPEMWVKGTTLSYFPSIESKRLRHVLRCYSILKQLNT